MRQYIRESWDLHAAAFVAFYCLALLLYWCGAISVWAVLPIAVFGAVLSVFGGLWVLALFGVTIPW